MEQHDQHLSGPYRSAALRDRHCPIMSCVACGEAIDLAISLRLGTHTRQISAAMHRVQENALEMELVRAEARRALIRGGLMVAAWVALLLVLAFSLRTAHAQPRAIEGGARESIIGESAASSPAGRAGAAGSALDRARLSERVLVLARTCAGEAGWSTRTGDCAAIVHVLLRRADRAGTTPIAMARAYSAALGPGGRPWVRGLALDGHEPAGWPERLAWARYRPGWLALVRHVRDVLAGRVADPCPGAVHWGMRTGRDAQRARRAGWRLVECSAPTRNAFWALAAGGAS